MLKVNDIANNLTLTIKNAKRGNRFEVSASGWDVELDVQTDISKSKEESSKVLAQDVINKLKKTEDRFEWTGEKFIMKPMQFRDQIIL